MVDTVNINGSWSAGSDEGWTLVNSGFNYNEINTGYGRTGFGEPDSYGLRTRTINDGATFPNRVVYGPFDVLVGTTVDFSVWYKRSDSRTYGIVQVGTISGNSLASIPAASSGVQYSFLNSDTGGNWAQVNISFTASSALANCYVTLAGVPNSSTYNNQYIYFDDYSLVVTPPPTSYMDAAIAYASDTVSGGMTAPETLNRSGTLVNETSAGTLALAAQLAGAYSLADETSVGVMGLASQVIGSVVNQDELTSGVMALAAQIVGSLGLGDEQTAATLDALWGVVSAAIDLGADTVEGVLALASEMVGYTDSVETIVGDLALAAQLIGDTASAEVISGILDLPVQLVGDSTSTESILGELVLPVQMAGEVVLSSDEVSGALTLAAQMVGALTLQNEALEGIIEIPLQMLGDIGLTTEQVAGVIAAPVQMSFNVPMQDDTASGSIVVTVGLVGALVYEDEHPLGVLIVRYRRKYMFIVS